MGFDLNKGEVIETGSSFNLDKGGSEAPLKVAGVGLGWNVNHDPDGPIFDLDVSAFCLGEDGQIPEMTDLVFFNSELTSKFQPDDEEDHPILQNLDLRPSSTDGAVFGAKNEICVTGPEDEDDAQDMIIVLDEVADHIKEIVIVLTITKFPNDEGKDRRTLDLDFSQVQECYCRVWDFDTDTPLCTYELDQNFGKEDAVVFGKFTKDGFNSWNFTAVGEGHVGGLSKLISIYANKF
jgi:tellurium resistance protein TerD